MFSHERCRLDGRPPLSVPGRLRERRCGSRGAPLSKELEGGSRLRDDARFRILRLISERPEISQRELAEALGLSLGGVNYCMKGLVERGMVKVGNFRRSGNKLAYAYFLTPRGASEKAAMTRAFLERRMAEYQALKQEIEALEAEVGTVEGVGR